MNRNKLIASFTANLTNAVLHKILEKAIDKSEIAEKYSKEIKNSWEITKEYRKKINPINAPLPDKQEVKEKIIKKVKAELRLRIKKGYENIDFNLVEGFVEQALKEMLVS